VFNTFEDDNGICVLTIADGPAAFIS